MSYFETRIRPEERQGVMHMDMLSRSFDTAIRSMGRKLAGYEALEEDARTLKEICERLRDWALKDQSADTMDIILRQSRDYVLGLERRGPVRRGEEVVMPIEDEWQFVSVTLESRCRTCMMTPEEAAACPVRRLLRRPRKRAAAARRSK